MRVCVLGWLRKTSLTNTSSFLRKFCLAVTLCKTILKMNAEFSVFSIHHFWFIIHHFERGTTQW
jgi:hypothetical protein